ncbi:glycosyltransferase family 4 protein [Humibacillus xanthopallidus]|uniref:glycosyltransferase family 4 protein n=1 Tax=Humibacillus xanthopallidus TaxID=412689 RepID=UPI00163B54CE|nr:glycosyltransferase family 4 protein [Humibacillus xanthopallidus]
MAVHVSRSPWQAAWVCGRLLPRPAVSAAADLAGTSSLGIVLTAASGRRDAASCLLAVRVGTTTGRARHGALAAGAAAGLVAHLATGHGTDDDDPTAGTAYVLETRGHLLRARTVLAQRRGPLARRHRRWLDGQIAVLRGSAVEPLTPPRARLAGARAVGSVLHVVTNALPDVQAGYTIRTHGILTAQRSAGRRVAAVTPPGYPVTQGRIATGDRATHDDIDYLRSLRPLVDVVPGAPDRSLVAHAEAVALASAAVGADVIHAHSNHLNAQAALIAGRRLDLPVVYEVRGFLEETWRSRGGDPASDFYRWTRATETRCMGLASAVVTLSEGMRDEIVDRGIDPQRVHVVGNCVDDRLLAAAPDGARARRELGIAVDAIVVGTVSTLNAYEGIDQIVAAAEAVDDPSVVVLVVGDGPELDRLRRAADRLQDRGIRTRVMLTGRLSRAGALAAQAAIDIFCVPRRATAVTALVPPLKPVEAMALGRPVLASDLPPLAELVTGGSDVGHRGVLVPVGDVEALAATITQLASDPARRESLGRAGRAHVASQRTWAAAARRYDGIYASLDVVPADAGAIANRAVRLAS